MTAPGVFYPPDAGTRGGSARVLREPVPDRRGRRHLLRAARPTPGRAVARAHAAGLHVRHQGARAHDRAAVRGEPAAQGPARGAAGRDPRQEAGLRARPADADRGRHLGALPGRRRAAALVGQARRHLPPVPALVLPVERVARRDREGEGAPGRHAVRRRAAPRRRGSTRRTSTARSDSSRSTRSRSSWSMRRRARSRRCRR